MVYAYEYPVQIQLQIAIACMAMDVQPAPRMSIMQCVDSKPQYYAWSRYAGSGHGVCGMLIMLMAGTSTGTGTSVTGTPTRDGLRMSTLILSTLQALQRRLGMFHMSMYI